MSRDLEANLDHEETTLFDPNALRASTWMLNRIRAGGLVPPPDAPETTETTPKPKKPSIRFVPHQESGSARPSLHFEPISRTLPNTTDVIRVGRFSEKDGSSYMVSEARPSAPVGFKSKVVSRKHCEFWFENGHWYIKDVKSSSGTFLNRLRLSPASTESRPFQVSDGDIVQLGIDFKGGEEMIFRCVRMRVECNRDWQKTVNPFNIRTLRRLQNLAVENGPGGSDTGSTHTSDCSICLLAVAPCQSLFVAPCSHVWHYKCIRPILSSGSTWARFQCPNCRAVADLDAEIEEVSTSWREIEAERTLNQANGTAQGIAQPSGSIEPSHQPNGTSRNETMPHTGNSLSSTAAQPPTPQQSLHPHNQPVGCRQRFASFSQSLEAAIEEIDRVHEANNNTAITPFHYTVPTSGGVEDDQANSSAEHLAAAGPMTPSNDIGPFVLDANLRPTTPPSGNADAASSTSPSSDSDFNPQDFIYLSPFSSGSVQPEQEHEEL
ncbi:MAG: hypothetical protein M1816_004830 [Peltula sp. TS41687]|nr:MAG: hypothetical protein M1816_004830 [Peltula sp. TS41687]